MTDKVLKNSGYKKIEVNELLFPNAKECFQKKIRDNKGRIKYIITVVGFDICGTMAYKYILLCETHYGTIYVGFDFVKPLTIEEIEQEIDKIWTRGDFNYYES